MKKLQFFRQTARWQRRALLCLLTAGSLWSFAQPDESKTYHIRSFTTDKVVSNFNNGDNDAPVMVETEDETSFGQKWKFVKAGATEGVYIITSAGFPTAAIDVAPNKNYFLLNWTANTASDNQKLLVQAVEGEDGVYQLLWNKTPTMGVTELSDSRLQLTNNLTSQATWFRLVETTEQVLPEPNKWEDETCFGENKLAPHATFMPYATTAALRADAVRYAQPWNDPNGAEWLSLNGLWKLSWTNAPSNAPEEEFWGDNADVEEWDTITVPSCLEMKGYGSPYYINVDTPFNDNYPKIVMRAGCVNSAASYRRTFILPEGWENDKRVVLHFDGIYSAAFVWVNGEYVGYTQESNNDAEFDLTSVVRSGENNIAVRVIRFSDGSYLEGQDMWRMSGIHRDVYLYATPKTYVQDHFLSSTLSTSDYTSGSLQVSLKMENPAAAAVTKHVIATLLSPSGEQVGSERAEVNFAAGETEKETVLTFSALSGLQLWSAETPSLYTVEISQTDADGNEEMAFATKHGFRDVRIKSGKVYVNGKAVLFKGVNTQDTHPVHGRSIDVATMLRDVQIMKQANINTVRGSHYPRQAKMYSMFDYYGLYCMDEADIECHYNWEQGGNTITRAQSWQPQFVDRMERMVMRDRNFPSVIFWSLGNESGTGINMQAAYNRAKELDPARIVHYEGATRGGASYTDLYSVMYPTVSAVASAAKNNSKRQPYFICEYAHAMGNAVGNLKEYWEKIDGSTYGIGGCIWDFVDQSIYSAEDIKNGTLTQNGRPKYMTGYDFPGPSQGNFVNNGLIPAHRAWTSKLAQVKQIYQYVRFGSLSSNKYLQLTNGYAFTNLNAFDVTYAVLCDGEEVETGEIAPINCLPGNSSLVTLPIATTLEEGKEYLLNVTFSLREATSWAEAGYPIAAQQYVLQSRPDALPAVAADASLSPVTVTSSVIGSNTLYNISNGKETIEVYGMGKMRTWKYDGKAIMENMYNFLDYSDFRWVENDEATGNTRNTGNGITAYAMTQVPTVDADGSAYWTTLHTGTLCNAQYDYRFYPNGTLDVQVTYTPQSSDLRRIGSAMQMPAGFQEVTYYARGPWDNFCDRKEAAFLGRYTSSVADMLEPTPRPQTSGNRTELRELTLRNVTNDLILSLQTEGQVDFGVLHHADKDLAGVRHAWNLGATPSKTILHLDYAQKGLGNGSCGKGTGTLAGYCLPSSGTYTHLLRFRPYLSTESGLGQVETLTNCRAWVVEGILHLQGSLDAGTEVKVYDLGGSCVATVRTDGNSHQTVNLNSQPRGTYLVKVGRRTFKVLR